MIVDRRAFFKSVMSALPLAALSSSKLNRAIYEELFPQRNIFSMTDILTLLQKKPELTELAGKIQRNEQYYLMIRKEHELEKKYV